MKKLLAIVLVAVVAACTPKVDTTSADSAQSSMKAVVQSVPESDRAEFNRLLGAHLVSEGFKKKPMEEILAPMNGMDAAAVLAHLRREEAARAAEARKQKENELAELRAEVSEYRQEIEKLSKISVSDVRIRQVDTMLLSHRYRLSAKISNGLELALSAIKVGYQLKSPERSVAWDDGDAWFFVKGGIEPSEEVEAETSGDGLLVLAKMMEEHPDAILTVSVVDAFGPDEKSIVRAKQPSRFDQARLEDLEKQLQ